MFEKAKQVRVVEHLEDSEPYEFDGILVNNHILVAMDNGVILDPAASWLEIVEELPWYEISF
jgi:hypothetical protein